MTHSRGAQQTDISVAGRRPVALVLGSILLIVSAVWLALRLPLGVPSEWTTAYRSTFPDATQTASVLAALLLFLLLAYLFDRLAPGLERQVRVYLVAVMTAAYGIALFAVISDGPLGRAELVTPAFEADACGLFADEARKVTSPSEYLQRFPSLLAQYADDYRSTVRVNNNPPGTTMLFYAADRIARKSPTLSRLASEALFGNGFTPPNSVFAANVIGAWLLFFGAALAFIPAYLVASDLGGKPSFLAASAAMLAGSMMLFNPGNDNFQVFFYLWMAWLFLKSRKGHPIPWGVGFGLVASVAFFFSLATAVVVIVLLAWNVAEWLRDRGKPVGAELSFWLGSLGGLVGGFEWLRYVFGYHSVDSLTACYRNHAMFYGSFPRTYWKWVLYNPVEMFLFIGGPLCAAIVAAFLRRPQCADLESDSTCRRSRNVIAATLLVLAALNLSGKNLSEVNRLWVFFMPLLAIPACVAVGASKNGRKHLAALALLQALNVMLLRFCTDVWRSESLIQELWKYHGR